MSSEKSKPKRKRHPKDDVWDACVSVLGYEPKTESEKKLWGRMTKSLYDGGATGEQIHAVAEWYQRHWPNIDLTITALEKWFSHFLAKADKRAKKEVHVCPHCEMGGGLHAADCPTLDGG
jgi:hypothetical protein